MQDSVIKALLPVIKHEESTLTAIQMNVKAKPTAPECFYNDKFPCTVTPPYLASVWLCSLLLRFIIIWPLD